MPGLQEQLQKVAEQLGIKLENAQAATSGPSPKPGKKTAEQGKLTRQIHGNAFRQQRRAWAPYNFIPLNETFVAAQHEAQPEIYSSPGFEVYRQDRLTGFIQCKIEVKTPLYIRGVIPETEFKAGKSSRQFSSFFSPGQQVKIPGSSLRGMVRTLVEIVSWGKFLHYNQYGLYYRGLADMSRLREEYNEFMKYDSRTGEQGKYQVNAGYIKKQGYHYFIIPAVVDAANSTFQKIPRKTAEEECRQRYKRHTFHFLANGSCVVFSGDMPGKNHDWRLQAPDKNAGPVEIPEEDVENYQADKNRAGLDLLGEAKKKELVPCFYVQWKDQQGKPRMFFGNTRMFRLPYEKELKDFVPEGLRDSSREDFAEAIFGAVAGKKIIAGRVYFEEAIPTHAATPAMLDEEVLEVLGSPKPTTFQHYLVQDGAELDELNTYNADTIIRGYKQYWHRQADRLAKDFLLNRDILERIWRQRRLAPLPSTHQEQTRDSRKIKIIDFPKLTDPAWRKAIGDAIKEDDKCQNTVVRPLPAGSEFIARIRFENLTPEELGALLFGLDLPAPCCHKLGMGKSLGLGSIKITPILYLSQRKDQRYKSLAAEWINATAAEDHLAYKKAFADYILEHIDPGEKAGVSDLWQTYRLKQLAKILNWQENEAPQRAKSWVTKTDYMRIEPKPNQFKDRKVLPIPEDVV